MLQSVEQVTCGAFSAAASPSSECSSCVHSGSSLLWTLCPSRATSLERIAAVSMIANSWRNDYCLHDGWKVEWENGTVRWIPRDDCYLLGLKSCCEGWFGSVSCGISCLWVAATLVFACSSNPV